jgi:hypothetical protein
VSPGVGEQSDVVVVEEDRECLEWTGDGFQAGAVDRDVRVVVQDGVLAHLGEDHQDRRRAGKDRGLEQPGAEAARDDDE